MVKRVREQTIQKEPRQLGLTLEGLVPLTPDELQLLRDSPGHERGHTIRNKRWKTVAQSLIDRGLLVANEDMLEEGILHVRCTEKGLLVSRPVQFTSSEKILKTIRTFVDDGAFQAAETVSGMFMERILVEYTLASEHVTGMLRVLHNVLAVREYGRQRVRETVAKLEAARPNILDAVEKELGKLDSVIAAHRKHFPPRTE